MVFFSPFVATAGEASSSISALLTQAFLPPREFCSSSEPHHHSYLVSPVFSNKCWWTSLLQPTELIINLKETDSHFDINCEWCIIWCLIFRLELCNNLLLPPPLTLTLLMSCPCQSPFSNSRKASNKNIFEMQICCSALFVFLSSYDNPFLLHQSSCREWSLEWWLVIMDSVHFFLQLGLSSTIGPTN
jgi:hypothetical protein